MAFGSNIEHNPLMGRNVVPDQGKIGFKKAELEISAGCAAEGVLLLRSFPIAVALAQWSFGKVGNCSVDVRVQSQVAGDSERSIQSQMCCDCFVAYSTSL